MLPLASRASLQQRRGVLLPTLAVHLKLCIYGYLNRIQSSRRREREAQRNVELMWSTVRLMPDFKTIANFHKEFIPRLFLHGLGEKLTLAYFVFVALP